MDTSKPGRAALAETRLRQRFLGQFGANIAAAIALIGLSLVVGMAGYHQFAGMAWVDAFANAAMMVSGMGPLDSLDTNSARLFGTCFGLYSGFAVIATGGLVIAPILHSFVQRMHLPRED